MAVDEEIKREEEQHRQAVQTLLQVEERLKKLYVEKSTVDLMYERFHEQGIDYQAIHVERTNRHEVVLSKEAATVTCVGPSRASALLGAYTALLGEMAGAV